MNDGSSRKSGRWFGLLAVVIFLAAGSQSLSEPPEAASASTISYAGRVASGKSSNTSTTANLTAAQAVAAGHALIIATMLNAPASGTVSASDASGNTYTVDRDQTDGSGNRLVVLSALNVKPLALGSAIKVTFPATGAFYVTVDDFGGVAALDRTASAWGTTNAFNSGVATTTQAGELLYAAEGQTAASATSWSAGWVVMAAVAGSGRRLSPAYEISGAAGPYSASGTGSGTWTAALTTYTAVPELESPPVARLAVTPSSGAAPLTVSADASASTDTDSTKISTYVFDFGDGSAQVGPQAGATASHTYTAVGTFTATVTVTDSAGLSSTASTTVTVTFTSSPAIAVYAGYYDTHHSSHLQPKPDPWQGSPNTVFVGTPDSSSGGWDTSAVRIANTGSGALSGVVVTVDIGTHHYALWGTQSIPAGQSLVLAQTAFENFDGSDTSPAGCYGCDPTLCITSVVSTIPVVHVTVNGAMTNYPDSRQILNTQGADKAGCPDTGGTRNDESETWQQLG